MTRANLKLLFRQVVKIVAGGPTDRTRGVGLLSVLDSLADSATMPEDLDGAVNVRAWSNAIDDWKLNELCTATVSGQSGFYRAKLAGGPFPAPTGLDDTYWHQEAPPVGATVQYQAIPLALAKYMDGEYIQPINYRILRGATGAVHVFGLPEDPDVGVPPRFSPTGWWLDPVAGLWKLVSYDVATDAVTPLSSGGTPVSSVDLLALTIPQMAEIIALSFDANGDAAINLAPAWSFPGQSFDAIVSGISWHYYCGRYRYVAGDATSGIGPAWKRFVRKQS